MEKTKKSSPNSGCGILSVILLIVVIVAACGGLVFSWTYAFGYFVQGTRPIPGDAAKFDPLAVYPQVVQFAGSDAQLMSIDMKFVKADGTLDLTADYGAETDYNFAHVIDTPNNAAPLGAGGKPNGIYAEQIDVSVVKARMVSDGDNGEYYNFGMNRLTIPATPLTQPIVTLPSCSAKQLWATAIKEDAPANAVATIRYDSSGYTFSIKDTQVNLQFDAKCQLQK